MNTAREIKLTDLVKGFPGLKIIGDPETAVEGVAYDSRKIKPGELFVAVPGTSMDGAAFIPAAIEAGAAAVLAGAEQPHVSIPVVVVEDVRPAMGLIAARLSGRPDRELEVIGITGTNGKTTSSYILESILGEAGLSPGVIGTVNYRHGSAVRPAPTTTPESVDIFEILSWMKGQGATHVIMEVSSHALDQKRVAGLEMKLAAMTNLSRDHLDYHRNLEDYYQAKKKLFTQVITGRWTEIGDARSRPVAAINLNDEFGKRLAGELDKDEVTILGFGTGSVDAQVIADSIEVSDLGIKASIHGAGKDMDISSSLIGKHNLENILTAAALAVSLQIDPAAIKSGVESLRSVPGRLEPVGEAPDFTVLVDYAHTPDALEHAVQTCASLTRKRLITVFGCGGDRDPGKRPQMGKIGVANSHLAVITSDNPRTEDPMIIIEHILKGVKDTGISEMQKELVPGSQNSGQAYVVEPDRRKAIQLAVSAARPGDMVLIAGKGHEDYQILGTEKIHFDDREEALKALAERNRQ